MSPLHSPTISRLFPLFASIIAFIFRAELSSTSLLRCSRAFLDILFFLRYLAEILLHPLSRYFLGSLSFSYSISQPVLEFSFSLSTLKLVNISRDSRSLKYLQERRYFPLEKTFCLGSFSRSVVCPVLYLNLPSIFLSLPVLPLFWQSFPCLSASTSAIGILVALESGNIRSEHSKICCAFALSNQGHFLLLLPRHCLSFVQQISQFNWNIRFLLHDSETLLCYIQFLVLLLLFAGSIWWSTRSPTREIISFTSIEVHLCSCASILSWFVAQKHFLRFIAELGGATWDILDFKSTPFPNFLFQTTTFLPKKYFL